MDAAGRARDLLIRERDRDPETDIIVMMTDEGEMREHPIATIKAVGVADLETE
jgi:hypothetical protein